jgi:outer membrane protein assembly factor BamB
LTQPVVAASTLLTAEVDSGTVYAINPANGQIAWQVTVPGRIDSPPAVVGGMAIFGCADGWVRAVRLSDGAMAWRFLASPADVKAVALNQVESLWPVHGSVLILDGVAYCSAGRSTWLDGGIWLWALDPATGEILHKTNFASTHPDYQKLTDVDEATRKAELSRTDQNMTDYKTRGHSDLSDAFSMQGGAIRDVLVSDGRNVFLHAAQFDPKLQRQEKATRHLFSTSSLLDGMENHRSHFVFGTGDFSNVPVAYSWIVNSSGARKNIAMTAPTGLMMVFDDDTLWGVKRGRGKYSVYKTAIVPLTPDEKPALDFVAGASRPKTEWRTAVGCRPRAMIQAGGQLVFGGVPSRMLDTPETATGKLVVLSAETGEPIARHDLDSAVRWDGMAADEGKLYLVTENGELQCWQ